MTVLFLLAAVVSMLIYQLNDIELFLTLAITAGTCFFHLGVRLLCGLSIHRVLHNQVNYQHRWFRQRPFEKRLYQILGIKRWKKHLPTFTPEQFSLRSNSFEQLAMASCQSEMVHELNILFSFIPVLFSHWFGAFLVFFITSILGAGYDLLFVLIQRYNRPRFLHLADLTNDI